MERLSGPAYRIETQRTRLRCLSPCHVEQLTRAITDSLAHLTPWMAWARHEPISHAQRLEWLRTTRGHFDLGSDYTYGIFDKDERVLLGAAGLKMGASVDERELGYWLHVDHVGKGLAREVALALVRVAFDVESVACVDVRVDPMNARSAKIPEKLGFDGPRVDPLSQSTPEGKQDMHVYSLTRVVYATSPARTAAIEAYDVLERSLPLGR